MERLDLSSEWGLQKAGCDFMVKSPTTAHNEVTGVVARDTETVTASGVLITWRGSFIIKMKIPLSDLKYLICS